MKRIFGFFSVVLLLIICLANAPPLMFEPVDEQQEIIVTIESDQVIAVPVTVEITDLALPLMFEAASFPEVTLTVNNGMLGMNDKDNTSYDAIQDAQIWTNQTIDNRLESLYENRLHLAKSLNGYGVPFVERGCL